MMFREEKYFNILAASMFGSREAADQLLAGKRYLFLTMMINGFNLPARGCSEPAPPTDGSNAPFPAQALCSPLPVRGSGTILIKTETCPHVGKRHLDASGCLSTGRQVSLRLR